MQVKLNPIQLIRHGLSWGWSLLKPLPKLELPKYPDDKYIPNVLIVEDDITTLSFLDATVRVACSAKIFLASSVREASTIIKEQNGKLDFMLLDWLLVDEDGIRVIKSWQDNVDGPILVLSAHEQLIESVSSRLQTLGVHNILIKPADLGALTSIIHRYTAESKRKRQFLTALKREALSLAHVTLLYEELSRLKLVVTTVLVVLIYQILSTWSFDLSALITILENFELFEY